MHLDGVEELAVKNLDADDVSVLRGYELLHERGGVQAKLQGVGGAGRRLDRMPQLGLAVKTLDAGTGAADVGLDHNRPAQTLGGGERLLRPMNDTSLRIGHAELFHEHKLAGLRQLGAEGLHAVQDLDAARLQVFEKTQSVEDLVAVIAIPGGGRHAVEDAGVELFGVLVGRVEVLRSEQLDVRRPAAVQLREERFKPVGLLVIDGKGKLMGHGHPRFQV